MEPDCKEALATLKRQDWPAWRGLPGCSMAELEDHFPQLSEDSGRANIGSRPVTTEFRRLELEGFRKPIKIWYRDDRIVQIEVLYPEGDVNGLLQSLGEPAAALDYYQRTVAYEKSALIYPERGIAVLTNPDRSAIIRVYLFGKTTLKDYREELHHPVEPARRLPRR